MKPHIRLRFGIWYCGMRRGRFIYPPYGHGNNPSEALRDWQEQVQQ